MRRVLTLLALALIACRSEPQTMRVEIAVTGMTCSSCVEAITHELGRLEGVQSVDVDLDGAKATVVYDAREVDTETFDKTIEAIGYGAEPGTPAPAP